MMTKQLFFSYVLWYIIIIPAATFCKVAFQDRWLPISGCIQYVILGNDQVASYRRLAAQYEFIASTSYVLL